MNIHIDVDRVNATCSVVMIRFNSVKLRALQQSYHESLYESKSELLRMRGYVRSDS